MTLLLDVIDYFLQNQPAFWQAARQHLLLSFSALGLSVFICLPAGIWMAHRTVIAQAVINLFSALRVLPSLVILFLVFPYLGIGFYPSLVALTVLACPPILINAYAGIRQVDPAIVEAAYGTGMSSRQVLFQVEIPMAAATILAGIRTATVEVISSATLAAFIGGGGLGDFITRGFALFDVRIMLVGAIPVALLSLVCDAAIFLAMRPFRAFGGTGS